ncbi:MAG: amino acid adenylation domain-containing protein [Ectothiorhodospiraceae bacterium]|nr:amino acid adenylation domain-containing protein [Ectothiorhodospiraceae bacterium]
MTGAEGRGTPLTTEQKRALLEQHLRARRERPAAIDLLPAQERLWFLDRIAPGNPSYNMSIAVSLRGPLDRSALGRALDAVVARHDALRSVFPAADGRPRLVVGPPRALVLEETRIAAGDDDALARWLGEEARRPFDLEHGPLVRAALAVTGPEAHVLSISVHHIVCDAWSLGVIQRELLALYDAHVAGRTLSLPPPALGHAELSERQRQALTGPAVDDEIAHWRRVLADAPTLELPTDFRRPEQMGSTGGSVSVEIGAERLQALRELGRRRGASVFMTMLTLFDVMLARHSGQDDILVGIPVANRDEPDLQSMVGFFVSSVVVRADLSGSPSFEEALRRVRDSVLDALDHRAVPFDKLVQELEPERSLGRNPIYQVMCTHTPATGTVHRVGGLEARVLPVEKGTSKFDLILYCIESETLEVGLEYSTDLFTRESAERMLANVVRLADAAMADPSTPIDALDMLGAEERRQVVEVWNATAGPYPRDVAVHRLVEARVDARPDAVAVTYGSRTVTYAELDAAANRLAHLLRARGIGPDTPVGVLLERGVDMVTTWLAILKAGGAYVPLDPEYPAERLDFMLADTGAPVLVTTAEARRRLESTALATVALDADAAEIAAMPATRLGEAPGGDGLAYIIYTSGSTGTPKGVAVEHRAINRLVCGTDYLQLDADDCVVQLSNASFDAATFEVWGALANGARLHGVDRDTALAPQALAGFLTESGATALFVTTALFNQVVRVAPGCFSGLGTLLFGGEASDPARVRQALGPDGPRRLLHVYGPTECTTFATWHEVREVDPEARTVPIGLPIANTTAHVLDARRQPVPVGVPGELYLGGDGVARGYWRRDALTAERFVPDPFGPPGARLYRTGDRVRRRADGAIEFVGRLDDQIKLRGFRIELGEIESVLARHPGVAHAVVICREDAPGDRRLVAYVVWRTGAEATVEGLRAHVRAALPEYMVPSALVALDALPLNPNGKIDRRRLPAPAAPASAGGDGEAPRGELESRIAEAWREVLRVPQVGRNDSFFDSGGDSILSIRLVARARELGVELTAKDIFQAPTVAGLARLAVGRELPAQRDADDPTGVLVASPVQQWFLEAAPVDAHHFNQSMLLAFDGALDEPALRAALDALVDHHDLLRARLASDAGPPPRLEVPTGGRAMPYERVDLTAVTDADLAAAVERETSRVQGSLDPAHGPLMRVAQLDLGPTRAPLLLLAAHHLVVDGVSWRILLPDLAAAYEQRVQGRPITLPPRTTSYRRWVERLAEQADEAAMRADAEFWLRQGVPGAGALPLDFEPAPDLNTMGNVRVHATTLDAELTSALLRGAHRRYTTRVDDLLLSGLVLALAPWTGRRAHTIDLEGHGRETLADDIDLSRTVGWFTAVYPVHLDPGPVDDPGVVVPRMKEALRAVPRRGVSYGALRYLASDAALRERLAAVAEPAVSFNNLGQFDESASQAGRWRGAEFPSGTMYGPRVARRHLLDVVAVSRGGRMSVRFAYCHRLHRAETIVALSERYLAALRRLVEHCTASGDRGFTPSDFPRARLDQRQLDAVMGKLRRGRAEPRR